MERTKIYFSNISSIGYEEKILEIEFKDGSIYQYEDVPIKIVLDLLLAKSKGSFFHKHIKKEFVYTKMEKGDSRVT